MIVREREDSFVMIEQHHHGEIAGQLYAYLRDAFLPDFAWRDAISNAIIYHDCGWIPFDEEPLWDDEKAVPYSFIDLPIGLKIVLYTYGIDQVAEKSPYAALLCSIHFVSFLKNRRDEQSERFVVTECLRQERIKTSLNIANDTIIKRHYEILKFFDDLSLYICLNELGTRKENQHFFFKDGLTVPASFNDQKLQLQWENEKILMNHDLFKDDSKIYLQQKVIPKKTVEKLGIKKAYLEAIAEEVPIMIGYDASE